MSDASVRKGSFLQFAIIFALVYMLTQSGMRWLMPEKFADESAVSKDIVLSAEDATVKGQHHPILVLENHTDTSLPLNDRCPMPPVVIRQIAADGTKTELLTKENAVPCVPPPAALTPGASVKFDLAPWKYSLFSEYGNYEAELVLPAGFSAGSGTVIAAFSIYEPGVSTQLFRTFVTKPLLNLFIFIASLLPGHNLAIAIILVTILVKLILYVPTQHALEGQRKMQAVQPKMDEIRRKYKDDPKKQQEETMKLWKESKVNPMQSCLPMLVQFPILIGLFYTVRDGSVLALSKHLLYPPYQHLTWAFGTSFFGLDLLVPEVYFFPIALVALQFFQMKLSFAIAKKKRSAKDEGKPEKKKEEGMSQQEIQQKVMLYALPLMIGFFALQFPAAVSLYWGVSTLFGIGQQLVVNRKALS